LNVGCLILLCLNLILLVENDGDYIESDYLMKIKEVHILLISIYRCN
jgi:hypothetical protein